MQTSAAGKVTRNRVNCCNQKLNSFLQLPPEAAKAEFLYARENSVVSMDDFPTAVQLKICDLGGNAISDFTSLEVKTPGVHQLFLNSNSLTDARCLPRLPQLEHLSLAFNPLLGMIGCPEYPHLRMLSLAGTHVASFEGMPVFPQLSTIRIAKTPLAQILGDLSHAFLAAAIPSLTHVDATPITDSDRALASQLPVSLPVLVRMGFVPSAEGCRAGVGTVVSEAEQFAAELCESSLGTLRIMSDSDMVIEGQELQSSLPDVTWERWSPTGLPCVLGHETTYTPASSDVGALIVLRHISGAVCASSIVVAHSPVILSASLAAETTDDAALGNGLIEGGRLHVTYEYFGGEPGAVRFAWITADTDENSTVFATTTEPSVTLALPQVGYRVGCQITPVRSDKVEGEPFVVVSEDIVEPGTPAATDFEIAPMSGVWMEGDVARLSFKYTGGVRGECRIRWYRDQTGPEHEIVAARDSEALRLTAADVGCRLIATLVPVSDRGISGPQVQFTSPAVLPGFPVATDLAFVSGAAPAENTPLQLSYKYFGGFEGTTTCCWLREGYVEGSGTVFIPIEDASGLTYTPLLADVGKRLRARVRPVRDDGTVGRAVSITTAAPVSPGAPTCLSLRVEGADGDLRPGAVLRARYQYSGGHEGRTEILWEVCDALVEGEPEFRVALRATRGGDSSFVVGPEHSNCRIRLSVTPMSDTGAQGETVTLDVPGRVVALPRFEGGEVLEGEAAVDCELRYCGRYAARRAEGDSVFTWQTIAAADLESGNISESTVFDLQDAREASLTVQALCVGRCLRCVAQPVDEDGVQGEWCFSEWSEPVEAKSRSVREREAAEEAARLEAERQAAEKAEAERLERERAEQEAARAEAERKAAEEARLNAYRAALGGARVTGVTLVGSDGAPATRAYQTTQLSFTYVTDPAGIDVKERAAPYASVQWTSGSQTSTEDPFVVPADDAVASVALAIQLPDQHLEASLPTAPLPAFQRLDFKHVPHVPGGLLGAAWRSTASVASVRLDMWRRATSADEWVAVPTGELPQVGDHKFAQRLTAADLGVQYRLRLTPCADDGRDGESRESECTVEVNPAVQGEVDQAVAAKSADLPFKDYAGSSGTLTLTAKELKLLNAKGKAVVKAALKKVSGVTVTREEPSVLQFDTGKPASVAFASPDDAARALLTLRGFLAL